MKASLDILRGELERLFSVAGLKELCRDYLDVDPESTKLLDDSKAVFVRRLMDYCERESAVEALADATMVLKKGMVDPRAKQIYQTRFSRGVAEGTVCGAFKAGEQRGIDDVGAVYYCTPVEPSAETEGQRFALWVIHGEHSQDAAAVQRFVTQMRILKTVDHPAVQDLVTAGRLDDGRPYVVVRWVDGQVISELKPVPTLEALDLFEAVLDALDAIHNRGLVHADLRLENVLLKEGSGKDGAPAEVMLLGMGSDRLFYVMLPEGPGGTLSRLGAVKALAPEVARGAAPDPRSDIYAAGVLLYELITGKAPFTGRSPADVLAAHLTQAPPEASKVVEGALPNALDALIQKMLAKEPAGRPREIDEIRRILGEVRRAAEEIEARAAQTGTREDIETWAEALLENPGDEEIRAELVSEARRCNAWGAAVEVLEEAALIAEEPATVRLLLLQAADATVRYLKDYEKAQQIYTQLLESDPEDQELAEAMLRLLRAQGRFEELIEKLAAKAEETADADAKLAVIHEIAEIYEAELKENAKAFDYYAACLGATIDEELLARLERLADKTGRFQDLATACGTVVQAIEASGDEEATVFYYNRIGTWYLERLDQQNYALTCFQKVLDLRPGDTAALAAVADLYRGAQQWSELAAVKVRLGETEQVPAASRDHLAEAARIYYERLSDTDQARSLLENVLTEDPTHQGAVSLLAKIHEKAEAWDKLAKLLATKADAMAEGAEQVEARYNLGELYEDRLDDLKGAQQQYEKALEIDNRHIDSIKGLERIYARTGDSAGLRDNLELQLEIAVTPRQRVLLLERLAEIYEEEFKDNAKAIDNYRAILEIDAEQGSALIALTRLYRRTERFEDLADVLLERAERTESEEDKRELLRERAEVFREDIGDAQRAADALQAVASLGVDDALEALAKTQEEAGNFAAAVETIDKMLAGIEEVQGKVAILVRKAHLQLEKLENAGEAAATLRQARDLDPQDRSLIDELSKVYLAQGNFSGALDLLEEQLKLVEGSHARAEIYAQMGVICKDRVRDVEKAIAHFEHALELDESNLTAGDHVSTLYRERGDWAKAMPIYERWAASADALPPEKQLELFTQMGEACVNLERSDDALKYFRRAAQLADEPRLMKRLGEVALELGEHHLAKEQFERYQAQAGDKLTPEERVDLFVKLGTAYLGTEDLNDAAKLARQATVMAPDNREARLLLAEIHEGRGDFRGAVEARQRVLAATSSEDEGWLPLVRRTATILFEKLRDADGASGLLKDALEQHPEDRDILGDLLKIYYATKRYADVVEVVLRIADLVSDPQQLSRYYLTVAKIYRRELKQPEDAIEYFELALEQDPTVGDAEESLVEIFSESQEWEKLEKHYKKAIARLPKDALPEEKLELYVPLADIVINKLGREKDGILLTEACAKLEPDNVTWKEKLVELYGWGPEYAAKAVGMHRLLLEANPARIDSFRMLYRIHSSEEDPDQAWCAASMLALLNQAAPDERKFYKDYLPEDVPTLESRLKDEHWMKLLAHEEINHNISRIFSVVGEAIFRSKAYDYSHFGLDPKQVVDVPTDGSDFAKFVNFAAGALDVDAPPLFYHEGQGGGFQLVDTEPPVLVAGKSAAALKDRLGLAFQLGQQLTLLRPGLYVRKLVTSGTELSAWLLASIKIFVQALPVPSDLAGPVQERLAPLRESLDTNALERLQGYVQSFVSKAADVNLKRWGTSVDYTMDRAGLLLCGDVAVAVRVLKEQIKDKKVLADRLRAMTLFTVSDQHHKLREHLGTALRNG